MSISNKIMYVNLQGQLAGAETSLLLMVKYLSPDFSVQVICPAKGDLAEMAKESGAKVHFLPQTPTSSSFIVWLGYFWLVNMKVLWILLFNRPKLLHANTTKAALATLLGVVLLRIRLVLHVRDAGCPRWILKVCSICSSKIIAVSYAIQSQLDVAGIKSDKVEVVYNSTEFSQYNKSSLKIQSSEIFTCANIGQFVPWKKQMLFIEAAETFLDRGNKGKFLIVGCDVFGRDATYSEKIRKRVEMSIHSKSFEVISWQKDLSWLWKKIDCLVHVADKEPFGRILIEAMEKKVPVIAANSFGPSEILQDGVTGFLFKPDDINGICHCMENVQGNQESVRSVVLAGYQHAYNNYNIQTKIEQLQMIYSKILAA